MNKKIIVIPVVVIVGILVGISLGDSAPRNNNVVFHATLADPQLYVNGIYSELFLMNAGDYHFRFVPNGSSPQTLSILISGDNFEFKEDFELRNKLHQTGISEYYTWSYEGMESFTMPESGQVEIIIDPNGMEMGSVTVDILKD